ncbi:hypothetical protein Vafri_2361, partial [Volvox africanus]
GTSSDWGLFLRRRGPSSKAASGGFPLAVVTPPGLPPDPQVPSLSRLPQLPPPLMFRTVRGHARSDVAVGGTSRDSPPPGTTLNAEECADESSHELGSCTWGGVCGVASGLRAALQLAMRRSASGVEPCAGDDIRTLPGGRGLACRAP